LLWWQALGCIVTEKGSGELVGQSGIVVGPHNHARLETQRGIGKRLYYYTLSATAKGGRFSEDGHANMLRYQVSRLLSRNDVVRVFRTDSRMSSGVHDSVVNDGVNSAREENPIISRQISEGDVFLLGSRVGLRESCIERRQRKWHGRDLRVLRRRRYQRQIQFSGHDTPNQVN
jgi:hypothetical protein